MKRILLFIVFYFIGSLSFAPEAFAQETIQETTMDPFGATVTVQRHKLTRVASRIWQSNPNFGKFDDFSQKYQARFAAEKSMIK